MGISWKWWENVNGSMYEKGNGRAEVKVSMQHFLLFCSPTGHVRQFCFLLWRYPPTCSSYWWRRSPGDPGLTVELALSPWRVGENRWSSGSRGERLHSSVHKSLIVDPALALGNVLGRSNTRRRSGRCHEEGVKVHHIHLDVIYGFRSVVTTAYFHKMFLQRYHLS